MPNRRLSPDELKQVNALLDETRAKLDQLAAGDRDLLFAFRRKVYKELIYDERDKPMVRRKLKALMRKRQGGICPECNEPLPTSYSVLDRFSAVDGYADSNVRLICQRCDQKIQNQQGTPDARLQPGRGGRARVSLGGAPCRRAIAGLSPQPRR
jgi:RNase P subunit RPR2